MNWTRRELMHAAVAGTALSVPIPKRSAAEDLNCITLCPDEESCLARESAAGYRRALQGIGPGRAIIVPAASAISWRMAEAFRTKAAAGHNVILESAFTFADDDLAERRCRIVRDVFGLPLELHHPRVEGTASYVQYRWPMEALVRSFGEPVYLRAGDHHPIAHHRSGTVAARKLIGRGQITFLGSPLGPLAAAEDREVTLLIRRMIAEPV